MHQATTLEARGRVRSEADGPAVVSSGGRAGQAVRMLIGCVMVPLSVAMMTGLTHADDHDKQLLESLEEDKQVESTPVVVGRLLDNTARAQSRLTEAQLDDVTTSIQQQILDDIDALLEQANPPNTPPPPSPQQQQASASGQSTSSEPQSSQGEDTQPPDSQEPTPDPNAASRESTERTSEADGTSGPEEHRLGLATAVWGHLPPKVREQMRSAFSETYLPEYDELVRRYYEALAARRNCRDHRDGER